MILGFPRAKQGLCHYDIWGGGAPSLIRYSSKTAEQNFMKLSGIVHYMMPYCTSYFKLYPHDFGVSQSKTRTLPYKTWGSRGYHFVSIAQSISSIILYLYKYLRNLQTRYNIIPRERENLQKLILRNVKTYLLISQSMLLMMVQIYTHLFVCLQVIFPEKTLQKLL